MDSVIERRLAKNTECNEKRRPRVSTLFVTSSGAAVEGSVIEHFCDGCGKRIVKFTFFSDGTRWEDGETMYVSVNDKRHWGCIPEGAGKQRHRSHN